MSGVLEFTESYFKKDVQILSNIGLDTFIKIVSINNTKTKTIENSKKDYDLLKKLCNKVLSNREDDNGFISRKIKYKQINNGRYFLNDDVGMQNMTRNIRAILSHRHLYDVDMVNAQPSILLKVCDENEIECEQLKHYCKNRDKYLELIMNKIKCTKTEAKNSINEMLYDENDKTNNTKIKINKIKEINKLDENFKLIQKSIFDKFSDKFLNIQKGMDLKQNKNGSFLARYLQMLENELLQKALDEIVNFTNIEVPIFDGAQINKYIQLDNGNTEEANIIEILNHLNNKFKNDGIKWACKEFDKEVIDFFNDIKQNIDIKDEYLGADIIDISKHILKGKLKDRLFWSDGILYYINNYKIINNKNTIESELYDFVSDQKYIRYEEKHNNKGEPIDVQILCSKKPQEIKHIIEAVINKAPRVHNFIDEVWKFTQFKLFFNNGYYDFKNKEFVKGKFSKTFIKINKDYNPKRNDAKYKIIYDKILNPIFTIIDNDELRKQLLNNFLYNISHFIAGDIETKRWLQMEGFRNSGKGVITDLLEKSFENYISSTNAGNFFFKKNITDEEKGLAWLYDFQFKRICYTSEIPLSQDIDGNAIKKFTSGGDSIKARKNYIDESKIKLQCGLLICCNDMPEIKPSDASNFRLHYKMKSKFIRKADNEYLNFKDKENDCETFMGDFKTICYKADENFKSTILNDQELLMEFINIIIDSYNNYVSYPSEMIDVNDDEDDYEKVNEAFIIVDDEKAFISNETFKEECKILKLPFTDKKLKELLRTKGAESHIQKYDGKTCRGLKYVKLQSVIDAENEVKEQEKKLNLNHGTYSKSCWTKF